VNGIVHGIGLPLAGMVGGVNVLSRRRLFSVEKITIREIARQAGVSKATVSRVLNQKPDVDPLTREHILRIVAEHNFVPSATASGLAGRSRLIGVLIPSFSWPFIAEIIRGIVQVAGNSAYELVLYSASDTTREHEESSVIKRILTTQLTAGILAVLPGHLSQQVVRLHRHNVPVVMIDDQDVPPALPWVGADNLEGAYTAVCHLMRLGHLRIAHIQGPKKYLCSSERYQGYSKALRERGVTLRPEFVLEGDFTEEGGYKAACKLFALPSEYRPTAVFAANDLMAYGVLAAAEKHGVHVPDDLALVGFDDISSSAHVRPALTTVQQPFYEMGLRGMKLLLSMIGASQVPGRNVFALPAYASLSSPIADEEETARRDAESPKPTHIQLTTRLVVRASCGSSARRLWASAASAL
jgi:LacI family transcriptional regulator